MRNLRCKKRIVGAGQHDSVNIRILANQLIRILLDEIISPWLIILAILDKWHPKRAGLLTYMDFRPQLGHLHHIRTGIHCATCSQDADMTRLSVKAESLGRRTDDAKNSPFA